MPRFYFPPVRATPFVGVALRHDIWHIFGLVKVQINNKIVHILGMR
jgi:hypothetical protein